jgi:predicted glycogen debranching enzyme
MIHAAGTTLTIPRHVLSDHDSCLSREWLVTNGLGGYASGTLLGAPTRRYHGMFVPDLPAPCGRTVMIPRLDEKVVVEGEPFFFSGVEFDDGRVQSDLPQLLTEFMREWLTPVWRLAVKGRRIEKRILMPYGQNSVYVEYRLVEGESLQLRLRPFVTFRMLNARLSEAQSTPFRLSVFDRGCEMHLHDNVPALKMCLRPQVGDFIAEHCASPGVCYRVDRDRGSEYIEDHVSPGYFTADLTGDRPIAFVASTESWEMLDAEIEDIFKAEACRVGGLLAHLEQEGSDELERFLTLAADQFIVIPGSRIEERTLSNKTTDQTRTVIAGYHWFTDWGRDTMISLEGLTLCTGRYHEAQSILRTFARYVQDGLLPNLFPEGQRKALYHTADATLWYFHALNRYYKVTHDDETLRTLYPVVRSILEHHVRGTHFGIGVDRQDGLLRASAEGYQLTWMDAKVDDWVVTPRRGKAVEIQALWYNALCCMSQWGSIVGEPTDQWAALASQASRSFNRLFWHHEGGYLLDVLDGEGGNDSSLRPNQILAVSLENPILDPMKWRAVVDVVSQKLMTPFGLRSLAQHHRSYQPRYFGDLRARDAAYHQGTVWVWLIGPFIDAWLKVYPEIAVARTMLDGFRAHLLEEGIGTVSEIFDGDPPYTPRGCIAQAWSVAEVLRVCRVTRNPEKR